MKGVVPFWPLALAGAACAAPRPTEAVRPPAVEEARAAEPAVVEPAAEGVRATSKQRSPCEVLRDLQEQAAASFAEAHSSPEPAACVSGMGGAYTFTLSYRAEVESASPEGIGYIADLVFVHADASGKIARSETLQAEVSPGRRTDFWSIAGTFDYDADGVDEVMVSMESPSTRDYAALLFRVAGDRLERYPTPAGLYFSAFDDVDGDGVHDLVVQNPFEGAFGTCGGYVSFGPRWVLHAVNGTFVFDVVSLAEARRTCPKAPPAIVSRSRKGVDNDELRRRLACAVSWGVPREAIVRQLESGCPAAPQLDACAYEGVLPGCADPEQLLRWADTKVPFSLR